MGSYMAKAADVNARWYLVDAEGQTLGRMASEVARILRGKHKPEYTPFTDTGDFVVVINAEKITVTGNKAEQKLYRSHSGYPGGLKEVKYVELQKKHPERIVEKAIRGMLPKNSLGRQMGRKLKVYAGSSHPHEAQKPELLSFDS